MYRTIILGKKREIPKEGDYKLGVTSPTRLIWGHKKGLSVLTKLGVKRGLQSGGNNTPCKKNGKQLSGAECGR